MNDLANFLTLTKKNKKEIIEEIKGANLLLKEYHLILLPFVSRISEEKILSQKNFLVKTLKNFYDENFNDNETNIGNYAHLMIDYKIKSLSNNSQIFLSLIFRPIFYFHNDLDGALKELEKCLIYHKLLSKKQIKAFNKNDKL